MYEPMLVRDGSFWKIADDVRSDSGFFARFISEHLDEALNPGFFDPYLRPAMRESVRARTAIILRHYADEDGTPHNRAWFDRKLRELSTYWGIDYGHRGHYDELVSIGNSCSFDLDQETAPEGRFSVVSRLSDSPTEPFERSSGFDSIAVRSRTGRMAELVSIGALPARRDDFGRTPLHAAALSASEEMGRRLLESGADPSAADDYGTTPLHLACRGGSLMMVRLLLSHGSDPNARSAAGTTPLHEAASAGDAPMARLLLQSGAKAETTDNRGRTPADVARAHGFPELASTLEIGRGR
jgi:hypothetical protein